MLHMILLKDLIKRSCLAYSNKSCFLLLKHLKGIMKRGCSGILHLLVAWVWLWSSVPISHRSSYFLTHFYLPLILMNCKLFYPIFFSLSLWPWTLRQKHFFKFILAPKTPVLQLSDFSQCSMMIYINHSVKCVLINKKQVRNETIAIKVCAEKKCSIHSSESMSFAVAFSFSQTPHLKEGP